MALALLFLAALPVGWFKGMVERRLSAQFGRPVTIASLDRVGGPGFAPTVVVRGLVIPHPDWAGPGDFVRLAAGSATLSVWPLLIGHVAPRDVVLHGLRLALIRRADGTTNWGGGKGGGLARVPGGITIDHAELIYRDARRDRRAVAWLSADPRRGLTLTGRGSVRGAPVTLALRGGAMTPARPWPFVARIDGAALAMSARGTMDRPLDTRGMTIAVTARADDLRLIDAVIEAGLFGTRPVALAAQVRRDPGRWQVTGLHGTVGWTRIAGEVATRSVGGRHAVTGSIVAQALAFDDFASTAGHARAAALRAVTGPLLVPDLPVDLTRLANTDGRIVFRIASIRDGGALRGMRGALTLDHQVLVVDPFRLDLAQGVVTGTALIAQDGRPVPTVALDLRLSGSSIPVLVGGGGWITGAVAGHARLTGQGATIRAAVGTSDGRIGVVARDGTLPARLAAELGFNAGGALLAGDDDRAALRCVVVPLVVRHGIGTLDPALVVDTSQSQLTGHGTVSFPSEALAITLTGAPKHGVLLRLPGSATIGGTIRAPDTRVAPSTKSVGNVLKALGQAILGRQGPVATDADCAALAAAALR